MVRTTYHIHLFLRSLELIHTILKQPWTKTKFIDNRGQIPMCIPQNEEKSFLEEQGFPLGLCDGDSLVFFQENPTYN